MIIPVQIMMRPDARLTDCSADLSRKIWHLAVPYELPAPISCMLFVVSASDLVCNYTTKTHPEADMPPTLLLASSLVSQFDAMQS